MGGKYEQKHFDQVCECIGEVEGNVASFQGFLYHPVFAHIQYAKLNGRKVLELNEASIHACLS